MSLHVAYLTSAPFIGGAERSLETMLRWLPQAGVEPLVVTPRGSAFESICRQRGIEFVSCPLPRPDRARPWAWWSGVRRLRRAFQRYGVQVVHSNQLWSYPAAARAAASLDIPCVCHLRDRVTPRAAAWWLRDEPEAVIAISGHIEDQFHSSFAGRRVAVHRILNPVEIPRRETPERRFRKRQEARRRLGLRDGVRAIGFIGQIAPVKGLDLLLTALARLTQDPRWELVVAGDDPRPGAEHRRDCIAQAQRLGLADRVQWTGFLDDPSEFYDAVDFVATPSREEPLGRVPLEAAGHFRPTVATAVGGLPETIRDGQTGWLVPADDPQALAAILRWLLGAELAPYGERARAWVEQVADPARYVERLAEIYRGLLWRSPVPGSRPVGDAVGSSVS